MADRYCGNCGNELRLGDRFCPSCGQPAHELSIAENAVAGPEYRRLVAPDQL